MATSPSSSVRQAREALAQRLREYRLDAKLTARALAGEAGWHESKVSRIEHARSVPSEDDLTMWCQVCRVPDEAADLIAASRAAESMYIEWRRLQRSGLKRLQESRLPLYERIRRFRVYEPGVVPGLLQTPGYVRAILTKVAAFRDTPTGDLDEAISARVARQKVLHEGDHTFAFVLEESALWSRLGGPETMAAQLGHLLAVAALPRVSVGVIPAEAERDLWPVEGFWMFDDERVAVETVSAWLTVTAPAEIVLYAQAFEELASLAVYGARTRAIIAKVIASLG